MSIYNKRKKKKYSEDGVPEKQSFVERHRELIVFLLVLIIVAGAVAAVNAYELKRNARIIGADNGEAELSYYESGAEEGSNGNGGSDTAAALGNGSGAEGTGASTGDSTEGALGAGSGTGAEGSEDGNIYPDFWMTGRAMTAGTSRTAIRCRMRDRTQSRRDLTERTRSRMNRAISLTEISLGTTAKIRKTAMGSRTTESLRTLTGSSLRISRIRVSSLLRVRRMTGTRRSKAAGSRRRMPTG